MNDVVFVALGTFSIYLLGLNTDQMNAHVQGFYAHLQLCSVALWSTAGGGLETGGRAVVPPLGRVFSDVSSCPLMRTCAFFGPAFIH